MGIGMDLMDQFVVSKVVKSGEPAVINDASKIPKSYPLRDEIRGKELGELPIIEGIKGHIEEVFSIKELVSEKIFLDEYVKKSVKDLQTLFSHRLVDIISRLEPVRPLCMPEDHLRKIFDGLIRNAVENTPDEGKIEVVVKSKDEGVELVVQDYGIVALRNRTRDAY